MVTRALARIGLRLLHGTARWPVVRHAVFIAYLGIVALAAWVAFVLKEHIMRRRSLTAIVLVLLGAAVYAAPAQQSTWPLVWSTYSQQYGGAHYRIEMYKCAGEEPSDLHWVHLMRADQTADVCVQAYSGYSPAPIAPEQMTGIQVRYTVHGRVVSPWLDAPFRFTLSINSASLPNEDGQHDLSIEVQGAARNDYTYTPIYLHLFRGGAHPQSTLMPVIGRECMYCENSFYHRGPGVAYVDPATLVRRAHPVDPTVEPWHGDTALEPNLIQEEMAPHTNLFMSQGMLWEQAAPPNQGMKFHRELLPKWDEDHRTLRTVSAQDRLPMIDGQRGIGWTSSYVSGQIDAAGGFAFVEVQGAVRYMDATGTVTTVAGWRVQPGKDPIWRFKALDVVRHNEELRGVWPDGSYPAEQAGMHTPLDLAIDPRNPRIWYVAGYEDNVIWKVDVTASLDSAVVTVFAGDPGHASGLADGVGRAARFHGPASLVFDPVRDVLYVADQDNDAIRTIARDGTVRTLFGTPGQDARAAARVTDQQIHDADVAAGGFGAQYVIQSLNRTAAGCHYARATTNDPCALETYLPQAIRVDSQGNLLLLDIGFGAIREINPVTLTAAHRIHVGQRFELNDEARASRGWAFLDVDRYGNAGPLDYIYYVAFQASWCDGAAGTYRAGTSHTNEAYCGLKKGATHADFLFEDWSPNPDGWGPREQTDPPHYGWLPAVDPRGAVLFAGGGEHGITRLRKRKPGDPGPFTEAELLRYSNVKFAWQYGNGGLSPSLELQFGSEAHNIWGAPDAWDYGGADDATIIRAFKLDQANYTPQQIADFIWAIRLWGARPGQALPPPPPPPMNNAPTVTAGCGACTVLAGAALTLTATASDADGDPMTFLWSSSVGALASPAASQTIWTAPAVAGAYTVSLSVSDGRGGVTTTQLRVQVTAPPPPPPPPPPVDPCIAAPLTVTVKTWPTKNTGSRSLAWDSGSFAIASHTLTWTPSLRVTFTDTRGCSVTKVK